jgi:hypothetical protein
MALQLCVETSWVRARSRQLPSRGQQLCGFVLELAQVPQRGFHLHTQWGPSTTVRQYRSQANRATENTQRAAPSCPAAAPRWAAAPQTRRLRGCGSQPLWTPPTAPPSPLEVLLRPAGQSRAPPRAVRHPPLAGASCGPSGQRTGSPGAGLRRWWRCERGGGESCTGLRRKHTPSSRRPDSCFSRAVTSATASRGDGWTGDAAPPW